LSRRQKLLAHSQPLANIIARAKNYSKQTDWSLKIISRILKIIDPDMSHYFMQMSHQKTFFRHTE